MESITATTAIVYTMRISIDDIKTQILSVIQKFLE